MLAVIETHPIQYHAPVYRALEQECGLPVTAIYGSDFSVAGYRDAEFQTDIAWDTDLLTGYSSVFLSRVGEGGPRAADQVSTRGLAAALARIRPAAVMLVGYSPSFHRAAFLAAWRRRYPLLFRGETNDHARTRTKVRELIRRPLLRTFYAQYARLLFIGRRSHEHFTALGCPDDRLVFSPYCVDTSPFEIGEDARARLRPEGRRELGLQDDDRLLLFSGKLSPRKDPALLLQAVRELPAAVRARVAVAFLGDGPMRAALEDEARANPSVRAHFLGFRNQTGLSRVYHAADLLVLPSRQFETWGLVVNEALHHGVPCVVSDSVGCAPDLVVTGKTGEVFERGSVAALVGALRRVDALMGRGEVRDECRAHVAGYSVSRAAEGIAEAFDRTRP